MIPNEKNFQSGANYRSGLTNQKSSNSLEKVEKASLFSRKFSLNDQGDARSISPGDKKKVMNSPSDQSLKDYESYKKQSSQIQTLNHFTTIKKQSVQE